MEKFKNQAPYWDKERVRREELSDKMGFLRNTNISLDTYLAKVNNDVGPVAPIKNIIGSGLMID